MTQTIDEITCSCQVFAEVGTCPHEHNVLTVDGLHFTNPRDYSLWPADAPPPADDWAWRFFAGEDPWADEEPGPTPEEPSRWLAYAIAGTLLAAIAGIVILAALGVVR